MVYCLKYQLWIICAFQEVCYIFGFTKALSILIQSSTVITSQHTNKSQIQKVTSELKDIRNNADEEPVT